MTSTKTRKHLYKDEVLDELSESCNVAQFVSFGPQLQQRFLHIQNCSTNQRFARTADAIAKLLEASPEGAVNIRSFDPLQPEGAEFVPNLKRVGDVVTHIERIASSGFYTIVNELVDVNDGGVSGVLFGNIIEFAPGATPRVVEGSDAVSLPRKLGIGLLSRVYGFRPLLDFDSNKRVEFSVHPKRRGIKAEHTIIWEAEESELLPQGNLRATWPNKFSRMVGDKAYGLVLASESGFWVPYTLVISRNVAPFAFGKKTGSETVWLRTCPKEPRPGLFTTVRGWSDPFKLLAAEDPHGDQLASVLVQDEVLPAYSGAAISTHGKPIVEGVAGTGDSLMLGAVSPGTLPDSIWKEANKLHQQAARRFGPVRLEWVNDGHKTWLVQLQQEMSSSSGTVIVPGTAANYHRFNSRDGIAKLRELIASVMEVSDGIEVVGRVGMTSHIADTLRRFNVPSRMVHTEQPLS